MSKSGPVLKLRMRLMLGNEIALGPGKADLLEGIASTGSIAAAGRKLGMSYKRAWMLVETMNRCFRKPLVRTGRGGRQRRRLWPQHLAEQESSGHGARIAACDP